MELPDDHDALITIMTPQMPANMKAPTSTRQPPSNPWSEARDQIAGKTGPPKARLQCRSFPSGTHIIIDGKHTEQVTPQTFTDLEEGDHVVEMQYVNEAGKIISKKEIVHLKTGLRVVCKLHFIKPKTLA
jgi:hypothetical protein